MNLYDTLMVPCIVFKAENLKNADIMLIKEMSTSSESWKNKLYIDVSLLGLDNIWPRYNYSSIIIIIIINYYYLESEGAKKSKYWENWSFWPIQFIFCFCY